MSFILFTPIPLLWQSLVTAHQTLPFILFSIWNGRKCQLNKLILFPFLFLCLQADASYKNRRWGEKESSPFYGDDRHAEPEKQDEGCRVVTAHLRGEEVCDWGGWHKYVDLRLVVGGAGIDWAYLDRNLSKQEQLIRHA